MSNKNDFLSTPCEVAIEITGRCNLNCKYCFNNCKDKDIPLSKIKDIIDQSNELGVFDLCLSGGEPFIRKDILEILNYAIKKDFEPFDISVVTNGTFLNLNIIKELDDMELIGSMQISIDSSDEKIHNSVRGMFLETMSALRKIKKKSSQLPGIGIVLNKQNYRNIIRSLKELSEYCSGFHLMNVMASKKSLENKDFLYINSSTLVEVWNEIDKFCRRNSINIDIYDYDLKKKETASFTGCTAGKTKIAITPELNVIPCDMARHLIIGNLNEMTLERIWHFEKANEIRNLEIEPCYSLNKEWYLE